MSSDGSLAFDIAAGVGAGLTCATYILAVLDSIGLALLDEQTWSARPDDAAWQERILALLRETPGVPLAHLQAVMNTVGIERIRPEEVAGCFASFPSPFNFENATSLGAQILEELG